MKIISLITLIICSIVFVLSLLNSIILLYYDKYLWAAKINAKLLFPDQWLAYNRALTEPLQFVLSDEQKNNFFRGDCKGLHIWKGTDCCALFDGMQCLIPGGPLVEDIIKKRYSCPK